MDWAIVYYTHGINYESVLERLKSAGIEAEAFLDSQCELLYIPGYYSTQLDYPVVQKGYVEAPSMIYIAVLPEDRERAGQILSQWHNEPKNDLRKVPNKVLRAIVYAVIPSLLIGLIVYFAGTEIPFAAMISFVIFWLLLWFFYFLCGIGHNSTKSAGNDSFTNLE